MTFVLLTIKPVYAEAILNRSKKYEYRKTIPDQKSPYIVYLYASDPVKQVIGKVRVPRVFSGRPYQVVHETIDETPHEPKEVLDYFGYIDEGHALELKDPKRIDGPTLEELREQDHAPGQNFRYV